MLAAVAGVIGAATVVAGAAIYIGHAVNDRWLWRNDEYAKLQSLKAGFALPYFENALGPPVFSRPAPSGGYKESTFRGHDYWVQALSGRGVVDVYAVTSCDESFRPTFDIPNTQMRIELRRSSLSDIAHEASVEYFMSGTTGYDYFYESLPGSNPTYYKSFMWGITDPCPDWPTQRLKYLERDLLRFGNGFGTYEGLASEGGPVLRKFREVAVVNTYVETAPNVYFLGNAASFGGFHIGPDRLLVRTTG
jgi:hypothetical protein